MTKTTRLVAYLYLCAMGPLVAPAQEAEKPATSTTTSGANPARAPVTTSVTPAVTAGVTPTQPSLAKEAYIYEMVHTRVRLEADGTGTRELTGRIRVQGESAIRELGLLRFPYASSFETLNIDYVRVRKPDGTVVSTPTTDVQDLDSEVSRQAPMYTDEREKHIAVKTLAVGDTLEYHLVWAAHDALAPGHFWFYDNFVRDQICLDEEIVVDVPRDTPVKFSSGSSVPVIKDVDKRRIYTLHNENLKLPENESEWAWEKGAGNAASPTIEASSFQSWEQVGQWFGGLAGPQAKVTPQIQAKADELTRGKSTEAEKIQVLYEFVSLNIHYIGVSLGKGRYMPHKAEEVLANRYGDCKDKHTLLAALLSAEGIKAYPALINSGAKIDAAVPSPLFDHLITAIPRGDGFQFVDTTEELGTLGFLWAPLRNKSALVVLTDAPSRLVTTPANPPGPNSEAMQVAATLDSNGTLDGKFRVEAHGDTEIFFRASFRATSESRWTELMQQFSAGMGFGGTVADFSTSRPEAIGEPYWIAYSYHRPDYSDWKERQISLPFPYVMLPKIAEKRRTLPEPVQLGSPKDMTFTATVTLPKGTKPMLPQSVDLDTEFAHYSEQYKFENGVLSGTRSLKTLVREIAGSKRQAYSDFVDSIIEAQSRFIPLISGNLSGGMGMPEGGGHSENEAAQKLYDEGYESLQLGAPRAATTALEQAVKLEPKWAEGWLLLGGAQVMASDLDEAIGAYQKAVEADATNVGARRLLAKALTAKRRDAEALKAWQEVLKLSPEDEQVTRRVTTLLLRAHRYSEALVYLVNAEKENEPSVTIQLRLAQAYLGSGDDDKSMEHFEKAITLDGNAEVLNTAAYELAEAKKHLNEALKYAQDAVKRTEEQSGKDESLDTSNLALMASLAARWDTLGWVQFQMGDYANATKYLESAWNLMQNPIVGDHLGQLYEKTSKKLQAARMYSMVLSAMGSGDEPALKQQVGAKLKALAANGIRSSKNDGEDLSELRNYRLANAKPWGGGYKIAEFGISWTNQKPGAQAWFLHGAEELKDNQQNLSKIKYRAMFPDEARTRVVQRGTLACSEISRACTLVLMPVEMQRPNTSWNGIRSFGDFFAKDSVLGVDPEEQ